MPKTERADALHSNEDPKSPPLDPIDKSDAHSEEDGVTPLYFPFEDVAHARPPGSETGKLQRFHGPTSLLQPRPSHTGLRTGTYSHLQLCTK